MPSQNVTAMSKQNHLVIIWKEGHIIIGFSIQKVCLIRQRGKVVKKDLMPSQNVTALPKLNHLAIYMDGRTYYCVLLNLETLFF